MTTLPAVLAWSELILLATEGTTLDPALLADLYHRERYPPLRPGTLSLDQIQAEYAAVGMTMPTRRAGRMAA